MSFNDRRKTEQAAGSRVLEKDLNQDQIITLRELENFGWELKFVRRQPFQPSVPVIFDPDRKKFAVIKQDGTLDENPGFEIRH